MFILAVLLLGSPARADELELITAALFGRLSRTATFDVNDDGDVTGADLSAQAYDGEPGTPGCGLSPAAGGRKTIDVDAVAREYVVRLPAGFDNSRPHPVVFGFHGFIGTASIEISIANLAALWPDAIGVYGEGLRRTIAIFPGITAQGWQLFAGEFDDRDVHFFDAMLARLETQYCINPRRVYATGHSNGGYMSHILACLRGTTIAAIGPMAGALSSCPGTTGVPAILSHGMTDNVVPFASGMAARDLWVARNDCTAVTEPYASTCELHPHCADGDQVAFCPFRGIHAPDPNFLPKMYRFFREHAL